MDEQWRTRIGRGGAALRDELVVDAILLLTIAEKLDMLEQLRTYARVILPELISSDSEVHATQQELEHKWRREIAYKMGVGALILSFPFSAITLIPNWYAAFVYQQQSTTVFYAYVLGDIVRIIVSVYWLFVRKDPLKYTLYNMLLGELSLIGAIWASKNIGIILFGVLPLLIPSFVYSTKRMLLIISTICLFVVALVFSDAQHWKTGYVSDLFTTLTAFLICMVCFVVIGHSVRKVITSLIQIGLERQVEAVTRARLEAHNKALQLSMQQSEDLLLLHERSRVARDIHDGLGQHLHTAKAKIELALMAFDTKPALARAATADGFDQILLVEDALDQAIEALVGNKLHESPLEVLLNHSLSDCKNAGIATKLETLGTACALPDIVKYALYRIGQEALTNVRRHAQATRVQVTIDYQRPQWVRMIIADNGCGLPPAVKHRPGHGLDNFLVRAEVIGGTTSIETAPGQGVRITTEIPVYANQIDASG